MSRIFCLFMAAFLLVLSSSVTPAYDQERSETLPEELSKLSAWVDIFEGNSVFREVRKNSGMDRDLYAPLSSAFAYHLGDWLDPEDLSEISDENLIGIYEVAERVNFYIPRKRQARAMANIVLELNVRYEGRGTQPQELDLDERSREAYSALLVTREMAKAGELSRAFSGVSMPYSDVKNLRDIDVVRDPGAVSLLEVSTSEDVEELRMSARDVDRGDWLIVSTHPKCHFSIEAMQAIDSDEELRESLPANTLFVARQGTIVDSIDALMGLNDQLGHLEMRVAWQDSSWPVSVGFWATPTFYFLDDGELVEKINGWPDSSMKERLSSEVEEHFGA